VLWKNNITPQNSGLSELRSHFIKKKENLKKSEKEKRKIKKIK